MRQRDFYVIENNTEINNELIPDDGQINCNMLEPKQKMKQQGVYCLFIFLFD
jgi:hypothetical protein